MNSIFEGFLSSSAEQNPFNPFNFLAAMLRFEAALARSQAEAGLIPQASAQSIVGTCKIDLFDVPKMVRESASAGSIAIACIESLKETVGLFNKEAATFVHFDCSQQDLMDSTMALVTRDALELIEADIDGAIAGLLVLAERHAGDPVIEPGLLQAHKVSSFGLICGRWAEPLLRNRQGLQTRAASALNVQWSGAASELSQGKGVQVLAQMATELRLSAPAAPSLTQRDQWLALACELGLLMASLGLIAKEIVLMAQQQVAELSLAEESLDDCRQALAAAQRTPQRVAALLTALSQDSGHSIGDWPAALAEWPALLLSAHASAHAVARTLAGLQVDAQRMRNNVEALRDAAPTTVNKECFKPEWMLQVAALTQALVESLKASSPS